MIKGETVILIEKIKNGTDAFGAPIFTENEVEIKDVLIGNPSTDAVINELQLYGKRLIFVLGIPKGDNHNWAGYNSCDSRRAFQNLWIPINTNCRQCAGQMEYASEGGNIWRIMDSL